MGTAFRVGAFLFVAVVLGITALKFAQLRRKAAPPRLRLRDRLTHRSETVGRITRISGGTAVVLYHVDGMSYSITAPIQPLERLYIVTSYRTGNELSRHTYMTTTLGDVCEGGSIRVRYRKDNPSEAVLMPNPVTPR